MFFVDFFSMSEPVPSKRPWARDSRLATDSMLGLTVSIHTFWKMKPKVIVMMATVCPKLPGVHDTESDDKSL